MAAPSIVFHKWIFVLVLCDDGAGKEQVWLLNLKKQNRFNIIELILMEFYVFDFVSLFHRQTEKL